MSALGIPVLINPDRAYWLSSIGTDVIHSTIVVDTIDANLGNISTLNTEVLNASTLNVSTLGASVFDVSGMYVSSIRGNTAFFSSLSLASDLSGGVGFVRFSVDASGIQVDGDPIRFDNLVYLTSTINIVQVSTIVDTDIFAQRGFFSTLSTGSLSANMVSLNQANISSLYVSSLEGFDISGADPVEWSLYPTLNSSITFQPGFVLSNVGSNLYFNGFDLTDVSGGGQNWSLFPAVSTVNMANNSFNQLSTLRFQDGGTLTSATGNNLLYNGQSVSYGSASNIQNWANFPAVANVNGNNNQMSNVSLFSGSNLALSGSNITNGNTFTNSLGVGGTSLISLASITSGGDITCRNLDVGDSTTSLADVNIYGATAVPGDSALYVAGGVQFDGGTIHGFSAGLLPVGGINTGRIDMLQAGFNLLHPLVGVITTGAGLAITAGGALSLAGGGYVEINTSTLQMINTSQGNKNTTVQAGFLTVDPDVAPTSSIKLFNTLGGGVEIDGGGQGSLQGFSTLIGANLSTINLNVSTINGVPLSSIQVPEDIVCSSLQTLGNVVAGASTITQTLYVPGNAYTGFMAWNNALGVSTTIGALRVNNIQIPDNITGLTNAPMPLESRIENFSSIQSGTMSTINLVCSTINGLPWDISGNDPISNNYSTLTASSFQVSSIFGVGNSPYGSTINVNAGLQFTGFGATSINGKYISSLYFMNNLGQPFFHEFSTASFSWAGGINPNGFMRIGGGSAYDSYFKNYRNEPCLSTVAILTSSIVADNGLDISGAVNINNTINVPLAGGSITFDDGSFVNYTRLEFNDCANQGTLVAVNNGVDGDGSNCAEIAGLGFRLVAGTGAFGGVRFYTQFPGTGWGLDQLDTGGATVWEYMYGTETPVDGYVMAMSGLSSFTGTKGGYPGAPSSLTTAFDETLTGPLLSSLQLNVSSINTHDARPAFTNNIQLSSMNLYQNSTTLLYWSTTTTSENINTSGYDTVVGLNGTFKIGVSLQFNNGSGTDEVEYFILKNGSVIPNAGAIVNVLNNDEMLSYMEIIEPLVNGDTIQVGCYTTDTDVYLSTIPGVMVESPAGILTMYKVN